MKQNVRPLPLDGEGGDVAVRVVVGVLHLGQHVAHDPLVLVFRHVTQLQRGAGIEPPTFDFIGKCICPLN